MASSFKMTKKTSSQSPSHPQRVLEAGLKEVLRSLSATISEGSELPPISHVTSIIIKTGTLSGYLFIFNSSDTFDPDLCERAYKTLIVQMKTYNEVLFRVTEPAIIDVESDVFQDFISKNSNFTVVCKYKNEDVVFAYMEDEHMPVVIEADMKDLNCCEASTALHPQSQLTFDLFLWLPLNKKLISYLKKGAEVTPEAIQKITKRANPKIYFKNDETDLFYAYFIKNKIISKKAG